MPTDADLLVAFRGWQQQRNLSHHSTVMKYGSHHRNWLDWLEARGLTLATAGRDDVQEWLAERRVAPRTRYHYLSRLSALYRWMIDEGHATVDPTARIPRPKLPEPIPRPISTDDLRLALELANPRTRAFLALAAFAGLRCKEIAGLRVDDVLATVDPPVLIVTSPKGQRERVVPLHPEVTVAVRRVMPRAGYVFPWWGDTSRPIQPHTVSHDVNNHLHGLGITETAHTLRAWFATNIYRTTRDLVLTQNLLGHRSAATTRHYVAVVPVEAASAVVSLSAHRHVSSGAVAGIGGGHAEGVAVADDA